MSSLHFESSIDDGFLRDLRAMNTQMNNLGNTVELQGARMDSVFRNVGAGIAAYVGVDVLKSVGSNIVDTTAKFEKFGIVLENTLGSKPEADSALNMVAKFAAKTPFQLDEVTDSFIKLTNQGFQPTYEEMVKLGDVASSTGKGFNQLAEALLDAQTGQFERLKEFGIKASANGDKVTFTFKNVKTTVDNTAQAIQQYILSLGELKGVTGANAKIAEGMAGSISNLADEFAAMYNDIGKNNKEVITDGISGIRFLVQNYATIGKIIGELVIAYGAYKAAVMVTVAWQEAQAAAIVQTALAGRSLTAWETIHTAVLYKVNAAQKALNGTMLANPYVLAATAETALVGALILFADNTVDADETVKELNKTIENTSLKATAALKDLQALNNDTNTSTAGRRKLIEDINKTYSEYLPNLLTEASTQEEVNKALKEANTAMERKIKMDAISDALSRERVKLAELEKTAADKSFTNYFSAAQAYIDIPKQKKVVQDLQNQLVTIREEGAKKEIDSVVKKVRTIKVLEGEIAELQKKRKETVDIENTPALRALEAQIAEKQALLDSLEIKKQKEKKDTRMEELDTENQRRINALTEQYGKEKSQQRTFQEKLLENEIQYYTERDKLLKTELEKAENRGNLIRTSIALTQLREQEFKSLLAATKTYNTQRGELIRKGEQDVTKLLDAGYGDHAEVRKAQMDRELEALADNFATQSGAYKTYVEETLPAIVKQGSEYLQGEISRLSLAIEIEGDPEKLAIMTAELQKAKDALAGTAGKGKPVEESWQNTLSVLQSVQSNLSQIVAIMADESLFSRMVQNIAGLTSALVSASQAVEKMNKEGGKMNKRRAATAVAGVVTKSIGMVEDEIARYEQRIDEALSNELELNAAVTAQILAKNAAYEQGNELFSDDRYGTMLANLRAYNEAMSVQSKLILEVQQKERVRSGAVYQSTRSRDAAKSLISEGVTPENFAVAKDAYRAFATGGLSAFSRRKNTKNDEAIKKFVDQQTSDEARALASIEVTTTERNKLGKFVGLEDKTKSLLQVYPQLIDAQGKLNTAVLEQVVADGKLTEADTARMQALLENAKAMEEYYAAFGDYIAGIFGGIGDTAAESMQQLYEAIVVGSGDAETAMQSLEKSISEMIESFSRDSIKYAFIEPLLGNLNTVSKQLGAQYAAGSITAEKMQTDITAALGAFYSNIQAIQPQLLEAYANADRLTAAAGFTSAFSGNESISTAPAAKSAGAQVQATITEQTGTILTGHTGAIMLSTERLAVASDKMLVLSAQNALYLQEIRDSVMLNLPLIAMNTKRMSEKL